MRSSSCILSFWNRPLGKSHRFYGNSRIGSAFRWRTRAGIVLEACERHRLSGAFLCPHGNQRHAREHVFATVLLVALPFARPTLPDEAPYPLRYRGALVRSARGTSRNETVPISIRFL